MQKLEKIYFVVSFRDHRNGGVNYELADNYASIPRGSRRVFGTGHYDRTLVMQRLRKCENGTWFKEQHADRRRRDKEDERYRQRLHREYLRTRKQAQEV